MTDTASRPASGERLRRGRGWWIPAVCAGALLAGLAAAAILAMTGQIDDDRYGWRWPAAVGAAAVAAAALLLVAGALREHRTRAAAPDPARPMADRPTAAPTGSADTPPSDRTGAVEADSRRRAASSAPEALGASPADAAPGHPSDRPGDGRAADPQTARRAVPDATPPTARAASEARPGRPGAVDVPEWAGGPGPAWGGELSPRPCTPDETGPAPEAGTPVRGFVRDTDGRAVPGAMLTLIDPAGAQLARAAAGADGWYQVTAAGAGRCTLITRARGHQPRADTVAVADAPVEFDIELSGAAVLAGTVRAADDQRAVPAARVVLVGSGGGVCASDTADDDGRFRLADLPAGVATLVVHAGSYRPAAVPVELGATGVVRADVELPPAAVLSGTARAARDDRPLPGTLITLLDDAGRPTAHAVTGRDGRYRFDDLDGGDYTLVAIGLPAVSGAVALRGAERRQYDLTLAPAEHPDAVPAATRG